MEVFKENQLNAVMFGQFSSVTLSKTFTLGALSFYELIILPYLRVFKVCDLKCMKSLHQLPALQDIRDEAALEPQTEAHR